MYEKETQARCPVGSIQTLGADGVVEDNRREFRAVRSKSKFESWVQDSVVCVVDKSNELGGITVTNDAEAVVQHMLEIHGHLPIVYQDTEGCWDALVHNGAEFVTFGHIGARTAEDAIRDIKEGLG